MSDFYQNIKNKLADSPTHTPDEAVWAAVSGGIAAKRSWLPFPIWYLLPLGILLLMAVGGGYYWGKAQAHAVPAIEQHTEQISEVNPAEKTIPPVILHDTLLLRDTLIQFVYLPAKPTDHSSSTQLPKLAFSSTADSVLFFINDQLYLKTKSGIAQVTDKGLKSPIHPDGEPLSSDEIQLPTLAKIKITDSIEDLFPSRIPRYPRPFIPGYGEPDPWREALRVDEKKLGLGFQGLNFPFSNPFSERSEWNIGLEGELVFTEKVSLLSGFQYRSNELKTEDLAFVASFPQPTNVNSEDDFKEMYLKASYLEMPFLAKYRFPNRSAFSPYVMGGPMISKAIKQELEYEYEDMDNEEYKLTVPLDAGGIHLSSWIISGGVAYKITPDAPFSLFAEARFRYNSNISPAEYSKISGLGLRIGGAWVW